MICLGIDLGIDNLGYALLSYDKKSNTFLLKKADCIKQSSDMLIPKRLLCIYTALKKLINQYTPELMVVENVYMHKNKTTFSSILQSKGVVLLLAGEYNIPVVEVTPRQVKSQVCGWGNANKENVKKGISMLLNIPQKELPKDNNATDAIAIAITGIAHITKQELTDD